jgi:hypothetical protein
MAQSIDGAESISDIGLLITCIDTCIDLISGNEKREPDGFGSLRD